MMNMQNSKSNEGYDFYFNYELNTKTWHQFVNKQIMQTYHRLVIEKQLKEAKKMEKDIKDQIDDMDRKIRHTDNEIQKMKDGNSSNQRDMNNNWNCYGGKNDYQHEPSFRPRGRGHMGGGMRGGGQMNHRMNPGGPGGRNIPRRDGGGPNQ